MQWFGPPWPTETERAPICEDDALRVDVPVGDPCLWCREPIEEGDRGVTMMELVDPDHAKVQPMHIECNYRQVMGGPAHVNGTCSCQGGPDDPDMGMTPREAAKYVWQHWTGVVL